ncbi:hypothetical protein FAIPA1_180015 [Frankia sp. AiPs1]
MGGASDEPHGALVNPEFRADFRRADCIIMTVGKNRWSTGWSHHSAAVWHFSEVDAFPARHGASPGGSEHGAHRSTTTLGGACGTRRWAGCA